jgi:hypothetical protein
MGVYEGKLHIVGGGEWFGLSATRRLVIVDLNKAPPPRSCFYDETPIFDQWNRTVTKNPPNSFFLDVNPMRRKEVRHFQRLLQRAK